MAEHRNRIKIALPLYGMVSATFLQYWLEFQAQVAIYDKYTGLITTQRPYVDFAMNQMISGLMEETGWDYLFIIEQDMRMPSGLMERLATLDPETHPIVGCLYFGRGQDDMRPVAGNMLDGAFLRLSYEQVCKMLPERGGVAGFHKVDIVGMGATAIHRSVLKAWPWTQEHPFFRTEYDDLGFKGHDIWFCEEAAKIGFPIHVDSSMIAEHIGEWRSNNVTYLASMEHALTQQEAATGWMPPPTAMTDNELTYLAQLAKGRRVLEVGSQYGNSTVAMAGTAEKVVAVDWFAGDGHAGGHSADITREVFFTHLRQMGLDDKVVTVVAPWEEALPRLKGPFDLIFIDAFHSEEATSDLLTAVTPLLAAEGIVAAHDYGRYGVKPAVDKFRIDREIDFTLVDTLAAVGVGIPVPDLRPRIVVPYVRDGLRKETVAALADHPVQYEELVADDSYYQFIRRLWAAGQTFVTIEQDMVPTKQQLDELMTCSELWCAYEYDYPPFGLYAGMGCAKFSATMLRTAARAMDITGTWKDAKHPPMHWCRVDGWLKKYLLDHGFSQHIHGEVRHLHKGRPAHDCTTPQEAAAILASSRA